MAQTPMTSSDYSSYAMRLASRIAPRAAALSAVSLNVTNASSLSGEQTDGVRLSLERQLRTAGVDLVDPAHSLSSIHLTLSENTLGLIWIAEIRYGAAEDVIMQPVPRLAAQPALVGAHVQLLKAPLCATREAVLDAAVIDQPLSSLPGPVSVTQSRVLVLSPGKVSVYLSRAGACELQQAASFDLHSPWSRDARGRLIMAPGYAFDAYVPGAKCSGTAVPLLNLQCRSSDEPWPVAGSDAPLRATFVSTANNFDGRLFTASSSKPLSTLPPFFSAAYLLTGNGAIWWFAGTDGRARAYSPVNSATVDSWGGDVAAISSNCDRTPRLLVSGSAARASTDSLRLFEMAGNHPLDTGAALAFDGPITALWTAANNQGAIAISHNITTGAYEAFTISVACHQ